ncbi:MAG TPA: methyltransferase domain-containing protein [Armatimonadota bacterium]|nr:methyltransferase domain-containing protein [Armatimonadota bacterium]
MDLLDALCCPDDRAYPLRPSQDGLRCPRCDRTFPIVEGIACLLPSTGYCDAAVAEAVAAEQDRRDQEAHCYDRLLGLRLFSLLERPAVLRPLAVTARDRVLEVGCGTGRMSLPLAETGAPLVLVDHSLESLRVLSRKLGGLDGGRVQLVQADAACLPIRPSWATRAVSCQVLEHLPTAAMRSSAVGELARTLGPGGRLAISAYAYAHSLRCVMPREGRHSGAIFFHRFEHAEFASLLAPYFQIERLTRGLIYVVVAHACKRR